MRAIKPQTHLSPALLRQRTLGRGRWTCRSRGKEFQIDIAFPLLLVHILDLKAREGRDEQISDRMDGRDLEPGCRVQRHVCRMHQLLRDGRWPVDSRPWVWTSTGASPGGPALGPSGRASFARISGSLDIPVRWKKPRKVFVNSMSDLFHPGVSDEFIQDIWSVMERTPRHSYQILTKRPDRMAEMSASCLPGLSQRVAGHQHRGWPRRPPDRRTAKGVRGGQVHFVRAADRPSRPSRPVRNPLGHCRWREWSRRETDAGILGGRESRAYATCTRRHSSSSSGVPGARTASVGPRRRTVVSTATALGTRFPLYDDIDS